MKATHKTRAINYLKQFGSITSLEAIRDLGNTRLSATIFDLRKDGHYIISRPTYVVTRFKDKNGQPKYTQVTKYILTDN